MSPRNARILLIFGSFAAGLLSVLAVIFVLSGRANAPLATASSVGGPFSLTDQNGKPISDADFRGKPFLMFFGFTHCPDVCPTALFEVSEVLRQFKPGETAPGAVFVTVDPERDTADKLKDYLASFDPRLVGATGSEDEIARTLKTFRIYAKKVPTEGGNYTMDNTALIYLMDKNGRFVSPFRLNRKPEEAAAELRRYL